MDLDVHGLAFARWRDGNALDQAPQLFEHPLAGLAFADLVQCVRNSLMMRRHWPAAAGCSVIGSALGARSASCVRRSSCSVSILGVRGPSTAYRNMSRSSISACLVFDCQPRQAVRRNGACTAMKPPRYRPPLLIQGTRTAFQIMRSHGKFMTAFGDLIFCRERV